MRGQIFSACKGHTGRSETARFVLTEAYGGIGNWPPTFEPNAVTSCYFKPEEQDSNFGVLRCLGFCPGNFALSWPKLNEIRTQQLQGSVRNT